MKLARLLSISVVGIFVFTTRAGADSKSDDDTPDVPPSPYTQFDPDGVPLAVTQKHDEATQDDLNSFHQQDQDEKKNKDWLLRSYEHQLQTHASGQGQQGNLYYQLTSNKDLAKLAGLPVLDDSDQPNLITDKTGIAPATSSAAQLRKDGSAEKGARSPGTDIPKPMMRSFGSIDSGGMHGLYASLPLAMPSPLAANLIPQQTQPAPVAKDEDLTSDLSMPGMIAAKESTSTLTDPTDSTLDVLPGESLAHARSHQDSNSPLELSLPMDADQLHKNQASTLNPQAPANATLPEVAKTKPPTDVNAKQIDNAEAPMPVSQQLPINPVRGPIANPYDILNR